MMSLVDQWNGAGYAQHSAVQISWATELLEKLELRGDERVLDVGCGPGELTMRLAQRTAFVLGIDSSPSMIDFARETHAAHNLEFRRTAIEDFSSEEPFDLVVSFSCLHWAEDQAAALKSIAHALKTGGRYLFSLGAKPFPLDAPYDAALATGRWSITGKRAISYTLEEYAALLNAAGLRVDRVKTPTSVWHYESREDLLEWLRQVAFNKEEDFLATVCDDLFKIYPEGKIPMPRLVVEGRK